MPPGYGQTKDAEGVNGLSFVRNTVCASTDYKEAEGPSVLTSQHASPLGVSLSQSHKLKEEEKKSPGYPQSHERQAGDEQRRALAAPHCSFNTDTSGTPTATTTAGFKYNIQVIASKNIETHEWTKK